MTFCAACPSLTPCCGLGVRLAARSRRAQITSRSARHSSRATTAAASPAAAVSEPTSIAINTSPRLDQVRQSGRCLTILYARRRKCCSAKRSERKTTAGQSEICGRRVSTSGTANDPPQQAPAYHCRALGNGCSPCWATASTASQAMQGSKRALQTGDVSCPRTVARGLFRVFLFHVRGSKHLGVEVKLLSEELGVRSR